MLGTLGPDELHVVTAFLTFADVGNFAKSCRAGRQVAQHVTHGCDLSHVPRHCNRDALCDAFHVKRAEIKQIYTGHARCTPQVLPQLLEVVGGWPGLKARLEKRRQKKRKEADLLLRRRAAGAKRRRTIDRWMATEKPLGDAIDGVAKWEASLTDRTREQFWYRHAPWVAPIVARYLYADVLDGGDLSEVKRAVIALDKTAEGVAEFRKRHCLGITRWTDPCWQ